MEIEAQLARLIDDREFHDLDSAMGTFNLFEAVGAVRGELRHSNFLAYLLSPSANHGLGTEPLVRILRAIISAMPYEGRPPPILELLVADLDDAVVHRERDNIDLLVEVASLNLVVLIENKIGAKASDGQLARYKQTISSRYRNVKSLMVFLTPEGLEPEEDGYVSFSYVNIATIIDDLLVSKTALAAETRLILQHYVTMLRRHIVPDEHMRDLARRLYERHKEAFDFVFECRPEPESLLSVAKEVIQANASLLPDRDTKTIVRFMPASWTDVVAFNSCPMTEWTRTGRNLLWEVKNPTEDRVSVALILGPAVPELRQKIYQAALTRPEIFQGLVKPMGRQWATIFTSDLLSPNAVRDLEGPEKIELLRKRLNEFIEHQLPSINVALVEIGSSIL